MLEVTRLSLGFLAENCYVVYDKDTKLHDCVIIDPGDEADKVMDFLERLGLDPIAILLTHGHFDHIGAVSKLLEAYPKLKVYAYSAEKSLLENDYRNLSAEFRRPIRLYGVSYLEDGAVLELLGTEFKLIATPGHTAGSCCYYLEHEKWLFSGDTLFRESYGRTDFPTGSVSDMSRSLKDKLLMLPDDVRVFPGHDSETNIGHEKQFNPLAF